MTGKHPFRIAVDRQNRSSIIQRGEQSWEIVRFDTDVDKNVDINKNVNVNVNKNVQTNVDLERQPGLGRGVGRRGRRGARRRGRRPARRFWSTTSMTSSSSKRTL